MTRRFQSCSDGTEWQRDIDRERGGEKWARGNGDRSKKCTESNRTESISRLVRAAAIHGQKTRDVRWLLYRWNLCGMMKGTCRNKN